MKYRVYVCVHVHTKEQLEELIKFISERGLCWLLEKD